MIILQKFTEPSLRGRLFSIYNETADPVALDAWADFV